VEEVMRTVARFGMALLLGLGSCAAGEMSSEDFYRGQVVDTDTGKPLAGALVVFFWERHDYSPTTKRIHSELHAVTEVLTDADGRFEVSAAPETTVLGPALVEVRLTDPIFFVPGYFLLYKAKSAGKAFRDPTVVHLERIEKSDDERENLGILSPSFPFSRTPLFLKALNAERARPGLPLVEPSRERKNNE
jgi:hypothetical protein